MIGKGGRERWINREGGSTWSELIGIGVSEVQVRKRKGECVA